MPAAEKHRAEFLFFFPGRAVSGADGKKPVFLQVWKKPSVYRKGHHPPAKTRLRLFPVKKETWRTRGRTEKPGMERSMPGFR
mgnify:CR=1 FL=1